MNLFNLKIEDFDRKINEIFSQYTSEELFEELKKCGLEVDENER